MLVTGEASGDMHGARLVTEVLRRDAGIHFCGMGGEAMRRAGVEILCEADKVAVVGLIEVFRHLPDILGSLSLLKKEMKKRRPDLLVLIDLPDFNQRLASYATRIGIPVLYYVCPQVWAWRSGRAASLARMVSRMAVILPFEQDFYRQYGVEVRYVGHPLLDNPAIAAARPPARQWQAPYTVGILPGSRAGEIRRMLPLFLAAGRQLRQEIGPVRFCIIQAPGIDKETLLSFCTGENAELPVDIRPAEDRYAAMAGCHAVMAASGTVTLELCLLDVPAVVAYRVHGLTYAIGRRLVRVDHISLVNLIARRRIVSELVQDEARPATLAAEITGLLGCQDIRTAQLDGYREVRQRLGKPGASGRVAEIVMDMLGGKTI